MWSYSNSNLVFKMMFIRTVMRKPILKIFRDKTSEINADYHFIFFIKKHAEDL